MSILVKKIHAHTYWLQQRLKTLATNIASADQPGYVGKDVESFSKFMQHSQMGSHMLRSHKNHMDPHGTNMHAQNIKHVPRETLISGNNITLEEEMFKFSDTHNQYSRDLKIHRAFTNYENIAMNKHGR